MHQPGARGGRRRVGLALIALVSLVFVVPLSGEARSAAPAKVRGAASPVQTIADRGMTGGGPVSTDVRLLVQRVVASGDHLDLPFIVIDKRDAEALAFGADGVFRGRAPVLTGLAKGDTSPPGIGQRRLADIAPEERITPAGRFVAALGHDLGADDVLWVDYDAGISLHRVLTGKASDRRLQRLASATNADNRISFGCINVPVKFFERVVRPLFKGTNGIVYILPESAPLETIFLSAPAAAVDRARP